MSQPQPCHAVGRPCTGSAEASLPGLGPMDVQGWGWVRRRQACWAGWACWSGRRNSLQTAHGLSAVGNLRRQQCCQHWTIFLVRQLALPTRRRAPCLVVPPIGFNPDCGRPTALTPTFRASGVDHSAVSSTQRSSHRVSTEVVTQEEGPRGILRAGCGARARVAAAFSQICCKQCQPDTTPMGLRTLSWKPRDRHKMQRARNHVVKPRLQLLLRADAFC